MNSTTQIKSIDPKQLAEMTDEFFTELMDVFTNNIPKELQKQFGSHEETVDSFAQEILQKTIAQFPARLMSILPMRFSQPTKFHWEFMKFLVDASAIAKREMASRFMHHHYDVEDDIKQTKEFLERKLASEYKTEVVLFKLMEEGRWTEALSTLKVIEIERESTKDDFLQAEVQNWKQIIAANTGNVDLFFESITSAAKIAGDSLAYDPKEATTIIAILLQKELRGFALSMSFIGQNMVNAKGTAFVAEQVKNFQDHLIRKIVEATFKNRKITTGDEFRKFIRETKHDTVQMYKKLNPFVQEIEYVFAE